MRDRATTIAVIFFLMLAATSALADLKSLSIQGRLTDNSGDPVADGLHSLQFGLFGVAVGGSSLWSESAVLVTTTDGLFTAQVGSQTPIGSYVIDTNDSLWLEIRVDGETMTPRTYLSSAAHARTAEGLRSYSSIYDVSMIRTMADAPRFTMYGLDSLEQIRLWGESWGEIYLRDEEPENYMDAYLTSNGSGTGGSLILGDNGINTIALQGGASGNFTVVVPTDAIDADEMLNEPGMAGSVGPSFVNLSSGNIDYTIDSVEIDVPSPGYVIVSANGYINLEHTNGVLTTVAMNIEMDEAFSFTEGMSAARVSAAAESGPWVMPFSCSRTFSVSEGSNTFYLLADYVEGASTVTNVARSSLRAVFVPTLYGALTLSSAGSGPHAIPLDGSVPDHNRELRTITVEDHKAQLAAQRRELESEFEARMQEIEARLDQISQTDASVR